MALLRVSESPLAGWPRLSDIVHLAMLHAAQDRLNGISLDKGPYVGQASAGLMLHTGRLVCVMCCSAPRGDPSSCRFHIVQAWCWPYSLLWR